MEKYQYEAISTIHEIDSAISEINEIWKDLEQHDITGIREIWNSSVAEEYINKFNDVDTTVNEIINYLKDLKSSWENYNELESSKAINNG